MSLETRWPPEAGYLLPRREAAFGVHNKLATYSLDSTHEDGGPKAHGFARVLGITIEDIDYLEAAVLHGIQTAPICSVRASPPHGIICVVDVSVRGLNVKNGRMSNVRTVWLIVDADTPPRLVSAYVKP